jgi:hypothetical protein
MIRTVSMPPAATEIVGALGLMDQLVRNVSVIATGGSCGHGNRGPSYARDEKTRRPCATNY